MNVAGRAGVQAVSRLQAPEFWRIRLRRSPLLHLFGLDHQRLVYSRNGQEQSLIDKQECRVVKELLA